MQPKHQSTGPARDMSERQRAMFAPTQRPTPKQHLTSVPMTLVTQCPPKPAHGLDKAVVRAKGGTREPAALTRSQKVKELEAMKASISPTVYRAAMLRLGVKA